jgi:hypothetical protein
MPHVAQHERRGVDEDAAVGFGVASKPHSTDVANASDACRRRACVAQRVVRSDQQHFLADPLKCTTGRAELPRSRLMPFELRPDSEE